MSEASSGGAESSSGGPVWNCELPPDLPAVCWDVVCDIFNCGHPHSHFDVEGCPRPLCDADGDCDPGEYCGANAIAWPENGPPTSWADCSDDRGECLCGWSTGGGLPDPRGYCLDPIEFPPEPLCLAADDTCEQLAYRVSLTHGSLAFMAREMPPHLFAQTTDCQWLRVERLMAECGWSPCTLLCEELFVDCEGDCTACEGTSPEDVVALMREVVDRAVYCEDCAACSELESPLCSTLLGC